VKKAPGFGQKAAVYKPKAPRHELYEYSERRNVETSGASFLGVGSSVGSGVG
jgi:hypothetical protein